MHSLTQPVFTMVSSLILTAEVTGNIFHLRGGQGGCAESPLPRAPMEWLPGTPSCFIVYIPKIYFYLKISLQTSQFPGRLGPIMLSTCRSKLFVPFARSAQQLGNICCDASLRFTSSLMLRRVVTDVSKGLSAFIFGTKQHVSVCMFSYLKGISYIHIIMDGKTKCPLFLYILAKKVCIQFRGQGNDKPYLLTLS